MKYLTCIITIIIFFSCRTQNQKQLIPNYQEKELSFLHLRYSYSTSNNWIKKPENILMIHETFKKVGYQNLIDHEEWEYGWSWYVDVHEDPKILLDSLEITYHNYEEAPQYYREFWQRRIVEKNDKIVYQVLQEIKSIMFDSVEIEFNQEMVNGTLEQLILIEYPERKISDEEANDFIDYLIDIGLHKSAYNLVSGENHRFDLIKWNKGKDEVLNQLNKADTYKRPWFEDNTN